MCVGVCPYQSPEPAFFTMDVPALDGGQRHRVGVLETDKGGEEIKKKTKSHSQKSLTTMSKTTMHALTDGFIPLDHGTTQPTATAPLSKAA